MNWFLSNPLQENPRVKKWVKTLLEYQKPLERAAGGELTEVLGCGHWGCVVDMPGTPWVLKLTQDPTEAHIWKKILTLIEDERYGADGFPRIKKIFELRPGVPYGTQGRTKRTYGIVREKVAPTFNTSGLIVTTPYTAEKLGMKGNSGVALRNLVEYMKTNRRVDEFLQTIDALERYRVEAGLWHKGEDFMSHDERIPRIERCTNRMSGPIGGALGESLGMLVSNGVVLNDVHMGNIGWRVIGEIDGDYAHEGLVIFDPGHTPTAKQPLPKEQWKQFGALG